MYEALGVESISTYPPSIDTVVVGSGGLRYRLVSQVNSGAMGIVFSAIGLDTDPKRVNQVVIKVPHVDPCRFSLEEINSRVGSVLASFQREITASAALDGIPGIVRSLDCGMVRCQMELCGKRLQFLIPFLVQELVLGGRNLDAWCEESCAGTSGEFRGIQSIEQWRRISQQLLEIVSAVHDRRYVHLDLWTKNILVTADQELRLIDFGSAFDEAHSFRKDGDFSSPHPWLAPERLLGDNRRNSVYWPADMYSVGTILYFTATGCTPPSPYSSGGCRVLKSKTRMKEEIRTVIQERNPVLASEFGVVEIIVLCMRPNANERQPARNVLRLLDRYQSMPQLAASAKSGDAMHDVAAELSGILRSPWVENINPVIRAVVLNQLQNTLGEVRQCKTAVYEVSGSREEMIAALLSAIATLDKGDTISGLTSHLFWTRQNFGPDGRVLAMIKAAVVRGVKLRWCLLIPRCRRGRKSIQGISVVEYEQIVHAQLNLVAHVQSVLPHEKDLVDVCVRVVHEEDILKMRNNKLSFVSLTRSTSVTMIAPDYYSSVGQVAVLRFWTTSALPERLLKSFDEFRGMGDPY